MSDTPRTDRFTEPFNARELLAEARQLERELAECRRDAERYRWLRSPAAVGKALVMVWKTGAGCYDNKAGESLDAAIDEAMEKK